MDTTNTSQKPSKGAKFLILAASFVIVVAGMKAAASLVVPFFLAAFIAIICAPMLFWLQRNKVPTVLAVLVVILIVVAAGLILATLVGTSLDDFNRKLPAYQERLGVKASELFVWLNQHGIEVGGPRLKNNLNPGWAMKMIGNILTGLGGVLTNAFLILLTVVFILLEASTFPAKIKAASRGGEEAVSDYRKFFESVNRYLAIKTVISLVTGALITFWLMFLNIDFPILWGILAFLLNFIPNIGSIIAAIPTVLLGLIQSGFGTAALVGAGYLAVNVVLGSLLEPRFMGERLGLSTLVVFLSLVFWGWVLGPVGMLLSVPLTMILKIALQNNDDTRWIAIMLGSTPHLKDRGG